MSYSDVLYANREKCVLCRNELRSCYKRLSVYDYTSACGWFDILVRPRCQPGHTSPYPTESTAHLLYATQTEPDFDIITGTIIDQVKDFFARQMINSIQGNLKRSPKAILDFSCGNDRFSIAAARCFPTAQVHAVDFSEYCPPFLKTASTNNIQYLQAAIFDKKGIDFDIIILRHVLEHSHDPISLLSYLATRLSSDGILYVETPNLDSGLGRVFRSAHQGFYVPRHIFHFSKKSLGYAFAKANLSGEIKNSEMPMMLTCYQILLVLRRRIWHLK